ncbi:MAG: 50S ribosomal protein L18 [Halothiobacillaceae bacterium]|nr:50S ribosomal protein L18 [Halothiobacillaceae bacterium]
MNLKKQQRLRRSLKSRSKMSELNMPRLCVNRTPQHIYAQIISSDGSNVVASASTLMAEMRSTLSSTGNTDAAVAVGRVIAERAKAAGIEAVAFDRSGFKYHGRIKALADSAREHGLKF